MQTAPITLPLVERHTLTGGTVRCRHEQTSYAPHASVLSTRRGAALERRSGSITNGNISIPYPEKAVGQVIESVKRLDHYRHTTDLLDGKAVAGIVPHNLRRGLRHRWARRVRGTTSSAPVLDTTIAHTQLSIGFTRSLRACDAEQYCPHEAAVTTCIDTGALVLETWPVFASIVTSRAPFGSSPTHACLCGISPAPLWVLESADSSVG